MANMCTKRGMLGFWYCIVLILVHTKICVYARSDKEIRERFYGNLSMNSSAPDNGEGSIAKMFDRVLEKEFSENDQPEGSDGSSFNSSVADQQAVLETVAKVTHEKLKKNATQEANGTRSFQFQDVFSLENEGSDDMTTLIDKKDNVFVMSNKKSKYPVLQVDLRLISDLVVAIVSAAIGGIIFSCLGQPVIVGYLLAGSLIGPGGLNFISEMVQDLTSRKTFGKGYEQNGLYFLGRQNQQPPLLVFMFLFFLLQINMFLPPIQCLYSMLGLAMLTFSTYVRYFSSF